MMFKSKGKVMLAYTTVAFPNAIQPGGSTMPIMLPVKADSWNAYNVWFQIMNNQEDQVPNFNDIHFITTSHTANSFALNAWNSSSLTLNYRISILIAYYW